MALSKALSGFFVCCCLRAANNPPKHHGCYALILRQKLSINPEPVEGLIAKADTHLDRKGGE